MFNIVQLQTTVLVDNYLISHIEVHTIQQSMIESRFQALRFQKSARENRTITLREIAEQTNLSLGTVQKLSKGSLQGVRVETLEVLCSYFRVASIAELLEYKAD